MNVVDDEDELYLRYGQPWEQQPESVVFLFTEFIISGHKARGCGQPALSASWASICRAPPML